MTRAMDQKAYEAHQKKVGKPVQRSRDGIENKVEKKRPKYGNVAETVDGVRMMSKREANRYRELGLLLKSGNIHWLARQVRFILPGGVEYVADFVYAKFMPFNADRVTIEDAKGVRTKEYIIKKKLMLAEYGIAIQEV